MSAQVPSKSILINAPVEVVWDLICDVGNCTAWGVSIKSIELFKVLPSLKALAEKTSAVSQPS